MIANQKLCCQLKNQSEVGTRKLSSALKRSFALFCIGSFLTHSHLEAKVKVKLKPIATNIGVVSDINIIDNFVYITTEPGLLLRKDLNTSSTTDYTVVVDLTATVGTLGSNVPSLPGLGYPVPETYDERGLLGFAAHPDFDNVNGTFWLWYTNNNERTSNPPNFFQWFISTNESWDETQYDHVAYVTEYTMVGGVITNTQVILRLKAPFFNHTGFSSLVWSPEEDTLLLGVGDLGSEYDPFNLAQNPALLAGKLLMLNLPVLESINWNVLGPISRFSELPANAVTVLVTGLRNPNKVHFEKIEGHHLKKCTGKNHGYIKYLGNTGQDTIEWIHGFVDYGMNFGFRPWEGNFPTSFEEPGDERLISYPVDATLLATDPSAQFYLPFVAYNHLDPVLQPNAETGTCLYKGNHIKNLKNHIVYTDWFSAINLAPCDSGKFVYHGLLLYSKPNRCDLEQGVPTKKMKVNYKAAGAKKSDFFYTTVNTDSKAKHLYVGGFKDREFIINQNTYPLGNPNLAGGLYKVVPE